MKQRLLASVIIALLLIAAAAGRALADTEDYVVDSYDVTFEAQPASAAVRVTMDMTYLVRSGKKSSGFKYIGEYEAEQLSGRDGDGKSIKTWVEQQRETRINWSFTPAGPGRKRIIVSFLIPDALTRSADANEFRADWAGIFRVTVNRAAYRFVFPDSVDRTVSTDPKNYSIQSLNNRTAIEVTQSPLKTPGFRITFSPAIAGSPSTPSGFMEKGVTLLGWISSFGTGTLICSGIFVYAAFMFVRQIVRQAKRAGGSSWSGSSSSSCAGGSSCSSSCGSSCGGGCGGGCGG